MPKNKIDDLRNHLFEAMEMLKSGDMDVETAKGVAQLGQVIVNVSKLEVDFVKNVANLDSEFFPIAKQEIEDFKERNFEQREPPKQLN